MTVPSARQRMTDPTSTTPDVQEPLADLLAEVLDLTDQVVARTTDGEVEERLDRLYAALRQSKDDDGPSYEEIVARLDRDPAFRARVERLAAEMDEEDETGEVR